MPTKERWAKMSLEEKQTYKLATRAHQQNNREYWRELNRQAYLKRVGGSLVRQSPLTSDPEVTKEKKRITTQEWQKNNPDKILQIRLRQKLKGNDTAKAARRRASKKRACPTWVNLQEIKQIYAGCPDGYHVDHIVPLKGKLVSGLHVPWNLQYLPAIENIKKGNRFAVHENS